MRRGEFQDLVETVVWGSPEEADAARVVAARERDERLTGMAEEQADWESPSEEAT